MRTSIILVLAMQTLYLANRSDARDTLEELGAWPRRNGTGKRLEKIVSTGHSDHRRSRHTRNGGFSILSVKLPKKLFSP